MLEYPWWLIVFSLLGVISLLSVLGGLLIAYNSTPHKLSVSKKEEGVSQPSFLQNLAFLVKSSITKGGSVEIINNGDAFLIQLLEDFQAAKEEIIFSVYIWRDGKFSDQIFDTLIKKQREGVSVKILFDGLGAQKRPKDLIEKLKSAGGKVGYFRPPTFGKLSRFHRRNHRRVIVIDKKVGYTGGISVSDEWLGDAQDPSEWRDIMFRLTGPIALEISKGFLDHWSNSTGELMQSALAIPERDNSEMKSVVLASSPADESLLIENFFFYLISHAQQSIYINTPYFIPSLNLYNALTAKAREGIKISILLPGKHIDNPIPRWAAQYFYQGLIAEGIKIYEYETSFLHSKFMVIDKTISVYGSSNFNTRSRRLDEEILIATRDTTLANNLITTFEKDLKESTEITKGKWKNRLFVSKFLETATQIIRQQA